MTLTIVYLFIFNVCISQNRNVVDSLLEAISQQEKDTFRVNTLNELAWEYRITKSKKARFFANEAKTLSDSLEYIKGGVTSLNRLGVVALYKKEFDLAEKFYLEILEAELKDNNLFGIGRAQNQLGEIYKNKGDNKKSLSYSLQSLNTFETINRPQLVAIVATNLGDIYRHLGQYDKAIEHLLKSLDIQRKHKNTSGVAFSYLNLSAYYIALRNYKKAIEYLENSKVIYKRLNDDYELSRVHNNLGIAYFGKKEYEASLVNYETSIELQNGLGLEHKDARIYNNLGAIYYAKNQLDLALEYYRKSVALQDENNDKTAVEAYANIGDIYYNKKEYIPAIEQYIKALKIAKKTKNKLAQLKILQSLSDCYSQIKNYTSALDYSNQYISLNDSIESTYRSAVNLKEEYEEGKKRELLLEKDKEIAEATAQRYKAQFDRKNILIFSLVVGLFLILLLFFSIFKAYREKQKSKVAEQDRQIQEQKVEELLKNQELKSLSLMMEGQEKERQRIAQDLHDRLGSMLSMVKMHFKSVEDNVEKIKASNLNQYQKANALLDEACDEVRKIAHHMASGVLTKFGLVAALEDLQQTLEQSKQIEVEFIAHGLDGRLKKDLEIPIYRIVQELISNILRHAKAKSITIQLLRTNENLNLTVEDDGVGFNAKDITTWGMGLKNIASRVENMNGELSLDSKTGNGTSVTINIPVN